MASEEHLSSPSRPLTPQEELEAVLRGPLTEEEKEAVACTLEYRPVVDIKTGKTYGNPCLAEAAGLQRGEYEFVH
ncbi:hypothetical protein cyc_08458 [Cyclospora cayetanensis]|uniref:Kazal-like domain-containing protein n=1 Tax=Cyclospora cayetanensis TaxID=88456 RepID=A0A1D3D6N3_9EIME|nr:hypothetical protein cyc_08458 [Cyclospora cayetanensis]